MAGVLDGGSKDQRASVLLDTSVESEYNKNTLNGEKRGYANKRNTDPDKVIRLRVATIARSHAFMAHSQTKDTFRGGVSRQSERVRTKKRT